MTSALEALKLALPYVEKVAATAPTEMNRQRRQQQAVKDAVAIEEALRCEAAASDLLAALKFAMPALEWCEKQWASSIQQGDGISVMAVVRAAIAKAETLS